MKNYDYLQPIRSRSLWSGILIVFLLFSPCWAFGEPSFEENFEWCKALSIDTSNTAMEAQVTCDYATANQAFNLAGEAAYIAEKICMRARGSSDPKLAWAAYNVSNQVDTAIEAVIKAARHIAQNSTTKDDIRAAKFLLEDCELTRNKNRASTEMALGPVRGDDIKRAEAYSEK